MRNGFPAAVVAMAMVTLSAPAAAEAHHVAGAGAECALVGNAPAITAHASFVSFANYNKPIAGQMFVDGTKVATISGFTFAGTNGTWQSAPVTSTPGPHHISGQFWWPQQDGMDGSFSADVSCPSPKPPADPTPTPTPVSTPEPTPAPAPAPEPPAAAPADDGGVEAASSESPRCVARKLGRYRITVTPKGALHGLVTFHLNGRGARDVRWFVDTRAAGRPARSWEWVHDHGRAYSIYLWARPRWGVHLWGRHTIEARAKVTDSCGKVRAVRVQRLYFNHDPRPDDPIFAH